MTRILIVDDDADLLILVSGYLSAYGFEVERASDVPQARSCLVRSQFDVVISDYNMPGESGLDLLDHVSRRYPGLPFILMSGLSTTGLKNEAMKRGCFGYVEKPFEFRDLVCAVEAVAGFSDRAASGFGATG